MTGFVEESAPVVGPAHRLDDEHDAAGHLDGSAEGARALLRALLEVDLDVLLRPEVDPEIGERGLERGHHPVRRELRVPFGGAERANHVPALGLAEADADTRAEEPVHRLLEQLLRRVENSAALVGELFEAKAEAAIELGVVRRLELLDALGDDSHAVRVERVQVLLGQLDPDLVEELAPVAVGLVRDRGPQHAERNGVAVDRRLEARLEGRDPLGVLSRQLAEVALHREAPELADSAVAVDRAADCLCLLEVGEETVGSVSKAVELGGGQRGGSARHGPRITTCTRSASALSARRSSWRSRGRSRRRSMAPTAPRRLSSSSRTRRRG